MKVIDTIQIARDCQFSTNREMARALGVSDSFLGDVLHGRRALAFKTACEWAVKLTRPWLPQQVLQELVGDGFTVKLSRNK